MHERMPMAQREAPSARSARPHLVKLVAGLQQRRRPSRTAWKPPFAGTLQIFVGVCSVPGLRLMFCAQEMVGEQG